MWEGHVNFFRVIVFFLNPCARLFYRKWQSSVLLKENDCFRPKGRLLRMKPVVCISFPLIFFFWENIIMRAEEFFATPCSLLSPSLSHFGVTDFTLWLQHEGTHAPPACWLTSPLSAPLSSDLQQATISAQLGAASLVQEAANQSPAARAGRPS